MNITVKKSCDIHLLYEKPYKELIKLCGPLIQAEITDQMSSNQQEYIRCLNEKISDIKELHSRIMLNKHKLSIELLGDREQQSYRDHQLSNIEARLILLAVKAQKTQLLNLNAEFNILLFADSLEMSFFLEKVKDNLNVFFESKKEKDIIFIVGDERDKQDLVHWFCGKIRFINDQGELKIKILYIDPLKPYEIQGLSLVKMILNIFQLQKIILYTDAETHQHSHVMCDTFALFYAIQLYKYDRDKIDIFQYFNDQQRHIEGVDQLIKIANLEYLVPVYKVRLPYKMHELTQSIEILDQTYVESYGKEHALITKKPNEYATKFAKFAKIFAANRNKNMQASAYLTKLRKLTLGYIERQLNSRQAATTLMQMQEMHGPSYITSLIERANKDATSSSLHLLK